MSDSSCSLQPRAQALFPSEASTLSVVGSVGWNQSGIQEMGAQPRQSVEKGLSKGSFYWQATEPGRGPGGSPEDNDLCQ